MNTIREQLIRCIDETSDILNIEPDLLSQLSNKSVDIEYHTPYPTAEESLFLKGDQEYPVYILGVEYKSGMLPVDLLYNKVVNKRIHKIRLRLLHEICTSIYINYIEYVNLLHTDNQPQNVNTETLKFLIDFEYYYSKLRQTPDSVLRRDYKRYWREITQNNSNTINSNHNFSHSINNGAKEIIYNSLTTLYNTIESTI